MMFILFFLTTVFLGLYLLSLFPKDLTFLEKFAAIFLLGTLFLTTLFFLTYPLIYFNSYLLYLPFCLVLPFLIWKIKKIQTTVQELFDNHHYPTEIPLLIVALAFSSWLFFRTIWLDFKTGQLQIAGKLWSDFGAHIPLIKSFSTGFNFPPQYPLFPGEHIRYHFLADFHFAMLEKMGLPLFWGINIFSILSLTALLVLIYSLGLRVFKQKKVAFLTVFLFLFNSSLSFLNLFKKIPPPDSWSLTTLFEYFKKIINNHDFLAFGPYDQGIITAFWDLNVYTNQRHLAFALGLIVLFLLLIVKDREHRQMSSKLMFLWGVIFGLTPLAHSGIFMIFVFSLPILFFLYPNRNFFLLTITAGIIALPTLIYFQTAPTVPEAALSFRPYYWSFMEQHTVGNFFRFWFFNLGLAPFLLVGGFFLAPQKSRLLFSFAFTPFLIGNFLSFSPDLNTNHKFFNFSLIIFNLYVAYFVIFLAQKVKNFFSRSLVVVLLTGVLTISGIIDLFPVINDNFYGLPDPNHVEDIDWIEKNSNYSSVFANSYFLYHPASLAGRKIVLGWPYFSWSAGYDTDQRYEDLKAIYRTNDLTKVCALIFKLNVSHVSINKQIKDESSKFDLEFWRNNFPLLYQNDKSGFLIFETKETCREKLTNKDYLKES